MLELALVENIQREDLNPIELAKAYQLLQKEYKMTQEAVAKKVGKERATIANFIRLLKLPSIIKESIRKGEISMGHAKSIMSISTHGEQIRVWRKIVKQAWSVRRTEEEVQRVISGGRKKQSKAQAEKSPQLLEIEDQLRTLLGTQVKVIQSGRHGKIEIKFFSFEDLERILDLVIDKS
jgi:ParB family chromosome partitioning protein